MKSSTPRSDREVLFAGATEHHDADRVVGIDLLDALFERIDQSHPEPVVGRIMELDRRDGTLASNDDG